MTISLDLLAFTFLILTVISGFWWFLASTDHSDNATPRKFRRSAFSYSLIGFGFFFWLINPAQATSYNQCDAIRSQLEDTLGRYTRLSEQFLQQLTALDRVEMEITDQLLGEARNEAAQWATIFNAKCKGKYW